MRRASPRGLQFLQISRIRAAPRVSLPACAARIVLRSRAVADPHYDVAVIGGGPGGYVAAIRAGQLGMKAVCVDERERPGGTCLHVGCIPSKALLDSTERFREACDVLGTHGIEVGEPKLDLGAMAARKDEVVETLTAGVGQLLDKHGVAYRRGRGRPLGEGAIEIDAVDGEGGRLYADHVILATGSTPVTLPDVEIDEARILTSTGALALREVPERLLVIGAGYIGLELGSVWSRLGAETVCIEVMDHVLPGMDRELGEALQLELEAQGLAFRLGCQVRSARSEENGVVVEVASADDPEGATETLRGSHLLVAVGRRPNTRGLALEEVGVETDEDGFVRTGEGFATSAEDVHAVGDLAGGPMLAHKAMDEGVACVEAIAGKGPGYVNYEAIPSVVYTWPEVASVGRTEQALEAEGVAYRTGRFRFRHNPRALCTGDTAGFAKVLACADTGAVLGAHVVGPHAGTLIHEVVVAMELGGSAEELGRTCHGHPTWNEAIREAALAVHGRALHG